MYLIKDGKSYLIENEVATEVGFDVNKNMIFGTETVDNVNEYEHYTFYEIEKKLNINSQIDEMVNSTTKANNKDLFYKLENKKRELEVAEENIKELKLELEKANLIILNLNEELSKKNSDVKLEENSDLKAK
ncbi:MAG: hypothetical protein RR478_00875 [Bacilli bacterium]